MRRYCLALLATIACGQAPSAPATAPSNPAALDALLSAGYQEPRLLGHVSPILGPCSKEDSWLVSYDFEATNPAGKRVFGHVCCGLVFRGCTIRF